MLPYSASLSSDDFFSHFFLIFSVFPLDGYTHINFTITIKKKEYMIMAPLFVMMNGSMLTDI